MSVFGVEDAFAVGTVFDVVGACILARGLMASLDTVRMTRATYWGVGTGNLAEGLRSRIDGFWGVGFLTVGFLLQLLGYAATIDGRQGPEHSLSAAIVAVVLGIAVVALPLATYVTTRPLLLHRHALRVAELQHQGHWTVAALEYLHGLGQACGHPALKDESHASYAYRVFDVKAAPVEASPGEG